MILIKDDRKIVKKIRRVGRTYSLLWNSGFNISHIDEVLIIADVKGEGMGKCPHWIQQVST
jgi:hypothetical protein